MHYPILLKFDVWVHHTDFGNSHRRLAGRAACRKWHCISNCHVFEL